MQFYNSASIDELNSNWRFETKYRINLFEYYAFKNALTPYVRPDLFTRHSSSKKYLVRSLYFDTRDYKLYREKIDGICNRIKFRIRTYGTNPDENPDIRIEMKVRKGKLMEKYGSFISHQQYLDFMRSRRWKSQVDPVMIEFARYIHKLNLVPKTLVQYNREGFQSRTNKEIRITFDHRIESSPSKELFPETISWHKHYKSQIVLEIKHRNKIPGWLLELIQNFQMKVIANSKYTNSIEIASNYVIYPP